METTTSNTAAPSVEVPRLVRLFGAHGAAIKITGAFFAQGQQEVGPHSVPQWVMDAFNANPKLYQMATTDKEGRGVLWIRPE
jgi:hypothetical protein